MKKISKYKKTI